MNAMEILRRVGNVWREGAARLRFGKPPFTREQAPGVDTVPALE